MKYFNEWKVTGTKDAFVATLLQKYSITKKTALRRYYDVRKIKIESTILPYDIDDVVVPDKLKMLTFDDMVRYKIKITPEVLKKYGFSPAEITWLIYNKKSFFER